MEYKYSCFNWSLLLAINKYMFTMYNYNKLTSHLHFCSFTLQKKKYVTVTVNIDECQYTAKKVLLTNTVMKRNITIQNMEELHIFFYYSV